MYECLYYSIISHMIASTHPGSQTCAPYSLPLSLLKYNMSCPVLQDKIIALEELGVSFCRCSIEHETGTTLIQ